MKEQPDWDSVEKSRGVVGLNSARAPGAVGECARAGARHLLSTGLRLAGGFLLPGALAFLPQAVLGASVWTVRVEEPTGLCRRTNEVTSVPLAKLGGHHSGFRIVDPAGNEAPWQVSRDELLFPVSLMPGELPEYKISCCEAGEAPRFRGQIVLKKIGMGRVELGNDRFRAVIDVGAGSMVEAYSLTADEHRRVNLVETTPEGAAGLTGDIHFNEQVNKELNQPSPIEGSNTGWTGLGGSGAFDKVELVENGPLRGRLRLTRKGDTWELVWTAESSFLRWRASRGFRFAAVSVVPFLPFNRFADGSEEKMWPDGPVREEPPNNQVGLRDWKKIPGGNAVYYRNDDNYGALGIIALDAELNWRGLGTRRFEAERKDGGATEIALAFPQWKGMETLLEERMENRRLRNPVLTQTSGPVEGGMRILRSAPREQAWRMEENSSAPTAYQPEVLSLNGPWELAWGEKGQGATSEWRTVSVPGTVHTQILEAPKYWTPEANWISYKEWWYRKRFRIPPGFSGKRVRLQFEATDYYADAYLNGRYLGRHEGYIDPYEYDVTEQAHTEGENELLVRVWTPVSYYWRHRPYYVKGSYGNVDQKPDDITAVGITRGVRIVAGGNVAIQDVAVDTRLAGNEGAEVEVKLGLAGSCEECQWELTLRPRNFTSSESYRIRAPVPTPRASYTFRLTKPHLWWTWDHGKPDLYTLSVRLLDEAGQAVDGQDLAVGIREIEKIDWIFYLNRKRFFIRGTNYYYNLFLSEMNRAAYEKDLNLLLGMNVNMIRLHCHYTNREFYDLADERGVLIFQDYLEAWLPHDRAFSIRAAELYDPHIRYVRNHPSIALWATSDEEDFENYRDLTKHLAGRPFFLDPQHRPVVRSTGRYGDAHVYHGWYEGSIWEYASMTEKFVSELGATGLPNYESLIKFLPDAWPIKGHEEEWIFHKLQIPEAMRAWGEPGDMSLKEYVPITQSYVARLFQIALERSRRIKYEPAGGILHFHAIDIWPSVTMAAIDFYRVPTKTYYTVQRSFSPVLASLEYSQDRWKPGETVRVGVWAINDEWRDIPNARINWRVVNNDAKQLDAGSFPVSMAADSSVRLGDVRWRAAAPGAYELRAEVKDAGGNRLSENVFEFRISSADQPPSPRTARSGE